MYDFNDTYAAYVLIAKMKINLRTSSRYDFIYEVGVLLKKL